VLLAGLVGVLLVWGPLLVTSPEEALSRVQRQQAWDLPETWAEVVERYEAERGIPGGWRVEERVGWTWEDWYEGGSDGWRWIVTYQAGDDDAVEELWFAVGALGQVSKADINAGFLDALTGVERAPASPPEPSRGGGAFAQRSTDSAACHDAEALNRSERGST
jgi:hypothetical protein